MNFKNIQICFILVLLLICTVVSAQNRGIEKTTTIESTVTDENNNPIEGALVYGNEGTVFTKTDASGSFSISVEDQSEILIEAEGYESAIFDALNYRLNNNLTLSTADPLFSDQNTVNIPFGKITKGNTVNAVYTINPEDILKYDNIQDVTEALNGRVPGLLGSSNIRGLGSALFVVDGLPRDPGTINLTEVEQITVLKDINSSILYGNQAANGVILVTTKRGAPLKRQMNFYGHYGISVPTALPNYLSSAEYMELYNEARRNDGLSMNYDESTISNFRNGNSFRYPNIDYYSNEYLAEYRPFYQVTGEFSGGNEGATYYTNMGWYSAGSLLDFGIGEEDRQNRFNVRGNIDLKVNDFIKSSLDAVAVMDNKLSPAGDYWSDANLGSYWNGASILKPHLLSPLLPIDLIDSDNPLLQSRKNDVGGQYLVGGTSNYLTNPIADTYLGGQTDHVERTFSFNNKIDVDLKSIIDGLGFHTNISFDYFSVYDQYVHNDYSVYEPVWDSEQDIIVDLQKFGDDVRTGDQNVGNSGYRRRFGFYGMLDYNKTFNEKHAISGALFGYGSNDKIQGDFQGVKNAHLGLRLAYAIDNKYLFDFSSTYVNSVKLAAGNRGGFSPSLGLAWVLSNEDFLSSSSIINYLKLKLSGGLIQSDNGIGGFYYYDDTYSSSGGFWWFDGTYSNNGTVSNRTVNRNLSFGKRNEVNLGFEGIFFNNSLTLESNIFYSENYDLVTRPQTVYPSFYSHFMPFENHDANLYKGAELGLAYRQNIGNLNLIIGGNFLYTESEVLKRDEVWTNEYQYRVGRPVDARYGLVSDGFFNNSSEIENHAYQAFGNVRPGDIKYVDQNDDGIIDGNDEVQIGRWQAPFSYGLNFRLTYKNLSLFAKGNGRMGADSYLNNNYYWVDGDDKYSDVVLNRWTEATKETATYPALSSASSSNNFRSTDFWLYRDDYFTIDRVQLTYTMPARLVNSMNLKQILLHVDASNLLTISNYKDYREIRIGSEPFYRSFSLGLKLMF